MALALINPSFDPWITVNCSYMYVCRELPFERTLHEKTRFLQLDFCKAFDTIEWPMIQQVLSIFNFGVQF